MPAPVVTLLKDLGALFRGPQARLSWLLLLAVLVQVGYWYLGSPGPSLLGAAERGLETATANIAWALLFFFLFPLAALKLWGGSARDSDKNLAKNTLLQIGDARFGLRAVLVMSFIAAPLLFFGARDPALQASYPWAGSWPGLSAMTLLAWAGLYSLYYLAYEFFYRGFLLRLIEPAWGLHAAVWTQALASALVHLGKPPLETLAAVPMGLVFAVLAVRTRSVLWPALIHLIIGLLNDVFSLFHQGLLFPELLFPAGVLP